MAENPRRVVTMKGKPLALQGAELHVGDPAPEFTVRDRQWQKVHLRDFKGKVVLISAVPSLDTGVCSAQTVRFNAEAANLPRDVAVLTISQDLPFAQGRFCATEGVERIQVLSDHVEAKFGKAYGVLIKGMRLLARSIFVVDKEGRIAYVQIVPELTEHPDYEAALSAVRQLSTEG
jgi:thiol peroxidase